MRSRRRPACSPISCAASATTACGTRARITTSSRSRGQLTAMGWARQAGVDLLEDEHLAARLAAALRAPALTALPDHTFPARKDSRFGVSLAQPMYLELWEVGLARLGNDGDPLWTWLRELYAVPALEAGTFDSYLHEAGRPAPAGPRTRADLSWWALLEMAPALPESPEPWMPGPLLLEEQGLAILREGSRYASLECGSFGGGHGHPDRLSLTLHADGDHWLADPGTGSYVTADLFWYRSTLAHDAPRLDGRSQPPGDARCDAFDVRDGWSWARGRFGDLARTLVAGDLPARRRRAERRGGADAGAAVASRRSRRGRDTRRMGGRSARRPVRGADGALHREYRQRGPPPGAGQRRGGPEPPPPLRWRVAPRRRTRPARLRRARALLPGANEGPRLPCSHRPREHPWSAPRSRGVGRRGSDRGGDARGNRPTCGHAGRLGDREGGRDDAARRVPPRSRRS